MSPFASGDDEDVRGLYITDSQSYAVVNITRASLNGCGKIFHLQCKTVINIVHKLVIIVKGRGKYFFLEIWIRKKHGVQA